MSRKPPPLNWPDGVPRFTLRRADDKRFFVYDLLHERRVSLLIVEQDAAQRALLQIEDAARKMP